MLIVFYDNAEQLYAMSALQAEQFSESETQTITHSANVCMPGVTVFPRMLQPYLFFECFYIIIPFL